LKAEITLTYVPIYRLALINCDARKPEVDDFKRISGKEYEYVSS
jgi:hypothetical protein